MVRSLWPWLAVLLTFSIGACAPGRGALRPGEVPPPPRGVEARAGSGAVTLTWEAVPGATAYNVYWNTQPIVTPRTGNRLSRVQPPYEHRGLTNGQRYYYIVTALSDGGESVPSREVSALPEDQAPAMVADLHAEVGDGEVTLTWRNPPDRDFQGVLVRRSPSRPPRSAREGTQVADTRDERVVDEGLSNGQTYYYAAFAYDRAGNYAPAAIVEATPANLAPPAPVSDLRAEPGDGEIVLHWRNPPDPDFAGVLIRRSTEDYPERPDEGTAVGETPGPDFTDTGLDNDTTYYYTAFAFDDAGNYSTGTEVRAKPVNRVAPGPVTAFRARRKEDRAVLEWRNPPDKDFAGVMIRRRDDGTFPRDADDGRLVVKAEVGQQRFVDTGLREGRTYQYAAFAFDSAGNYAPPATTTDTTAPPFALEEAKLSASDARGQDQFGLRVAVDGAYAVVGAFQQDVAGPQSGAAYVFHRGPDGWRQQAKLVPEDGAAYDRFGFAVAIDGDYVLVGAYQKDGGAPQNGAAYLFRRQGDEWAQAAKLLAPDREARDWFGFSVALQGDQALIGAPLRGGAGRPKGGAAYVFRRDGTIWLEQARLGADSLRAGDFFGFSVALDGPRLVVGAPLQDGAGMRDAGAAYLFRQAGTTWVPDGRLTAPKPAEGDLFGFSVDISGQTAVVGALFDDEAGKDAGAAYLFGNTPDGWSALRKLTSEDARYDDAFGFSVAIDGEYALVGAYQESTPGRQAGVAYVYRSEEGEWREENKLVASDARAGDGFGSVALSRDFALIGASRADAGAPDSGAVYVFH